MGVKEKKAFTTYDELWSILKSINKDILFKKEKGYAVKPARSKKKEIPLKSAKKDINLVMRGEEKVLC